MLGLATSLKILRENSFFLELGIRFGWMNTSTRFMRWSTNKLILEVLGTKDGDLDKKKLSRYNMRVGVIENSPDGDLCHVMAHM